MGKIKCCPKCGNSIEVSRLCQYSKDFIVGKRGKLLKKFKIRDCGSLDVTIACCTNKECNVSWDNGEFYFDEDYCFIDCKYTDEERENNG